MKELVIISGASKGIGYGLLTTFLEKSHHVIAISRSKAADFDRLNEEYPQQLDWINLDLSKPNTFIPKIKAVFSSSLLKDFDSISLIHNAGVLSPISPIGSKRSLEELTNIVSLNLLAPMLIDEIFLNTELEATRKILYISSGAGRRPIHSWSAYCATKAAIDRYATCLSLEQADKNNPVKVSSLAPGVVDTEMQQLIRSTSKEVFPGLDRFIELKEEGKLWSPEYVAVAILGYLAEDSFGETVIDDLRDYVKMKGI